MNARTDQILGCILGGAIGDGWGRPYEGKPVIGLRELPGQLVVTDDTQLTLATCEAISASGRADPAAIAARFVAWFRARRLTGLGASTLKALTELEAGAHWALAGAKGERAAGNGAAMRIAPLAFLLDLEQHEDRRTLRDVCRITHHHDEAYIGALAMTHAIQLACVDAFDLLTVPRQIAARLPDSQVRDRLLKIAELDASIPVAEAAERFGNTGFVVDSVPLAIFAAGNVQTNGFEDAVQQAVSAGGDTDSIGSMTGQIAGARVGLSGIRPQMLERLGQRTEIIGIAEAFAEMLVQHKTE